MFRTLPDAVPAHNEGPTAAGIDLIPLSHLELDLPAPPLGWLIELDRRGISVVLDDLGRKSISRDNAKMLLAEQSEAEDRKREMLQQQEQQAIEADRQWRAQMPRGVPWYEIPDGVPPVVAMTAAAKAAQPRRTPSHAEWLFGEVDDMMVFHSLQNTDEP